jgi:O-methyltransferase
MKISKIIFAALSGFLSSRKVYLISALKFKLQKQQLKVNHDYVRYRTLELCHEEMLANRIPGNIAELGVFQGNFAQKMNELFHDKKIYLFDTFEGFDPKDVKEEQKRNFSSGNQDFSNTNVAQVLNKMPHPEMCIVKKGYFPDTTHGVEDRFCFVSLDTDLYTPILNGLEYFYPRLVPGGVIFVHDFNNDFYPGAKKAVKEYCLKNSIAYIPIPDSGGTVIIPK